MRLSTSILLLAAGMGVVLSNPTPTEVSDPTRATIDNENPSQDTNDVLTDDKPFFEGDMKFTKVSRNGILNPYSRWPNRVVPYKFESIFATDAAKRDIVIAAMNNISGRTCVRFSPASATERDYVAVTNVGSHGGGCWSYVGRIGNGQQLNLESPGCITTPIAIHELIHAIGFGHTQTRFDRDKFIQMNAGDGIDKDFTNYGLPYDYRSAMHYGQWTHNGGPAMVARSAGVDGFGAPSNDQSTWMSALDVAMINAMYGCAYGKA